MERLLRFSPLGMTLSYLLKVLILGAQPVDAAVLLVLAGLCGYANYKTEEKIIVELKKELEDSKKSIQELYKRDEEVRTSISSMKIGMSMRQGLSKGPG